MQDIEHSKRVLDQQRNGLPIGSEKGAGTTSITYYATLSDRLIIIISALCAILAGALNPILTVSTI